MVWTLEVFGWYLAFLELLLTWFLSSVGQKLTRSPCVVLHVDYHFGSEFSHFGNLIKQTCCFPVASYHFWRRQWHPAPVLLPGKSHGWRSLVGCSPWGHEELDTYWATSLSLFTFMHWRRKWQPTPVFLPGESQGRQSLVGCHLWGRTESDLTEAT